jgi:[ribosomal protein S5]-alanine N-acetyltransferase
MIPPRPWPVGPTLNLRPVEPDDSIGPYSAWINSPDAKKFLAARFNHLTPSEIREYIVKNNGDPSVVFFAICLRQDQRHIGNLKIQAINRDHQSASISIVVGETVLWGSGKGTEAIALACQYSFETLNLHRLDAGCFEQNRASARIFEKCGFAREGLSREMWLADGVRHSAIRLGLLREDKPLWRQYLGTA